MSEPAATAQPVTVPAAPASAETVTGASLLSDLPPVNERAVAAVNSPAASASPAAAPGSNVESGARAPVPSRFLTNPDGSVKLDKRGRPVPRGGRKSSKLPAPTPKETGSTVPPELTGKPAAPSPTAPAVPAPTAAPVSLEEYEASAEGILRGSYSAADALLRGKGEWQPDDESEHVGMKAALVAWQRSGEGDKRPPSPGWGFLLAILGFVLKRLDKPHTSKRLLAWFPWLAGEEEKPAVPEKPATVDASQKPATEPSTSIA